MHILIKYFISKNPAAKITKAYINCKINSVLEIGSLDENFSMLIPVVSKIAYEHNT